MKKICQQCGEELIGKVNRCWRCDAELDSTVEGENGLPRLDSNADSRIPVAELISPESEPRTHRRVNPSSNPFRNVETVNRRNASRRTSLATGSLVGTATGTLTGLFSPMGIIPTIVAAVLLFYALKGPRKRIVIVAAVGLALAFVVCMTRTVMDVRAFYSANSSRPFFPN